MATDMAEDEWPNDAKNCKAYATHKERNRGTQHGIFVTNRFRDMPIVLRILLLNRGFVQCTNTGMIIFRSLFQENSSPEDKPVSIMVVQAREQDNRTCDSRKRETTNRAHIEEILANPGLGEPG